MSKRLPAPGNNLFPEGMMSTNRLNPFSTAVSYYDTAVSDVVLRLSFFRSPLAQMLASSLACEWWDVRICKCTFDGGLPATGFQAGIVNGEILFRLALFAVAQ